MRGMMLVDPKSIITRLTTACRTALEEGVRRCHTARHYEVTGVEITERFLNNARRQAAQRGFRVAWERRDMRDLSWEDEFDAALNWFGNF